MIDLSKNQPDRPHANACYNCPFRRGAIGSAHSRCGHPSIGKMDSMTELMSILSSVGRVAAPAPPQGTTIKVTGDPYGISKGWFSWPYNFDPVWLRTCTGYVPKEPVA